MTPETDTAAIFDYHHDMMEMHGRKSSYALGWKDPESQQVRFKALCGIADLHNRSVLDAGCGYGDLLPYLSDVYGPVSYTGIEQIPVLLDEAIGRYGHLPGANFISGNFITMELPAADYVFASGSLNYRSADDQFIKKAINKLYAACRFGLAFNLLSRITPNGLIVSYNPEQIARYCSSISPNVKMVCDYDPDDFTIYMYKAG